MDPTLGTTGANASQAQLVQSQIQTIQENANLVQQFNDTLGQTELEKAEASFEKDAKLEIANLVKQAGQRMAQG
jgi:mevalonate kinase